MVKGGIREANVSPAIESNAVQLQLEVIVAVASGIEDDARSFIDLRERRDLERLVAGQRRDERAREVVQIEVGEAVAFRLPDESLVVFQELHRRPVVDPARRPLFTDDDPRRAGLGVRGDELQDVLAAIGSIEQHFAAVGRPRHAVDVVADDGVVERLAIADIDLRALLRGDVVDPEVHDWVGRTGFRVRLHVVGALNLGLIELKVVVEDLFLVEAVVRDLAAVG